MGRYDNFYPEYVPVAEKKKQAEKKIAALRKKGMDIQPVVIEGQAIAKTYWGKAWCKHLETYKDYAYRLDRGRSYVRHGAVIDLKLEPCAIHAQVNGSSLYKVKIKIDPVQSARWQSILDSCSGKIGSLIELLQGKFSANVMEIMTNAETGLFPGQKEIKFECDCPDYALMCKHVAAVLYGIGARIDNNPEDLFSLRKADYADLVAKAGAMTAIQHELDPGLADGDISALFGIEMDAPVPKTKVAAKPKLVAKAKKAVKTKAKTVKKTAKKG
ncbi:MAG: SWIM zinc finger family protein [Alphaproteobacteria bacterium]|nr:SWIM zinc finger family protein [Alphaproteobacteria bacterium]